MHYLRPAFILTLLVLPALALAADTSELGFVPLTSIPGIADAGNASTLPAFLNSLYKLAIGAAAVLAVLQIIRAGIMYMGGDSVTEKKEAKNLIALTIGGLILVLSPVIVFSIINPKILDLKIDGLDALGTAAPEKTAPQGTAICTPACTEGKICDNGTCKTVAATQNTSSCSPIASGAELSGIQQQNCCVAQTGCKVQVSTSNALAKPSCVCTVPKPAGSISVIKYIYAPVTGTSKDLGPLPESKAEYDSYIGRCTSASGKIENTYGTATTCPASASADTKYPAYAGYVKCAPDTVTCK